MKSGMLIPLLFLSLVIHEAQGMRFILPNSQHSMSHQAIVEMNNEEVWKSKHFSGRARKLMNTSPIPTTRTTTTSIDKNEKEKKNKEKTGAGRKEESMSVDSSSTTEQRRPETYPDILDIAGMDYSQARRKPPIHN